MNFAAWLAMAGVALLACAAHAADPAADESAPNGSDDSSAPSAGANASAPLASQGVRAYLDPVTGEMVDGPVTPEQRAQAEVLPAPDYSRVTFEPRADGSVIAYSNGQFQSTTTITLDADGKARIGCTQTGDHAQHGHPAPSAEAR